MSSGFDKRMTQLNVTRTRTASGMSSVTTTDGNNFGVRLVTLNGQDGNLNEGVPTSGNILLATLRESALSRAIPTESYVRIEGSIYRVSGISKGNFDRQHLNLTLRLVDEVQ